MKNIKKTILVLMGVILAIFIMEIALRLFPSNKFEANVSVAYQWKSDGNNPQFRPSKIFGYEHIPNSSAEINSFGMRDKAYTLKKPDGVFRILLLGDSICEFGHWSDYVEDMLNKNGKYEILNCGTCAWGLKQYYLYLKSKGKQFNPDMVLLGLCLNDVDANSIPVVFADKKLNLFRFCKIVNGPGDSNDITLSVNPFLFKKSYFYRWTAMRFFLAKKDNIAANADTLQEMKTMANGKLFAVVFPYLKPLEQYNENEKIEYNHTINYLKQSDIEFIDLTPYFNGYGKNIVDFRDWAHDKIHFNDEANKIKAMLIYDWLIKRIEKSRHSDAAVPRGNE